MVVVLNHIDTVPEDRRASMVDDVRRLLVEDGLSEVPVLAVSARQGIGIDALKGEMAKRVASKKATKARNEADVPPPAERFAHASGSVKSPPPATAAIATPTTA